MKYWLLKSEPDVYSIDDLQHQGTTIWDGVRNYQARNFLKSMEIGDRAFFYHSNTNPPGIVGLMEIVASMVVDPSQFEEDGEYFDPKSTSEHPRWHTIKAQYLETFPSILSLTTLREAFSPEELLVVKRGNRLSVLPIALEIADRLLTLARSASSSPSDSPLHKEG
jgi:predicted RNA-binding protein with PUA-like domain